MWDEASANHIVSIIWMRKSVLTHDNGFHENEMEENKLPSDYYMV